MIMPNRIVTSTYRYKRPPRKRKAAPLDGPAVAERCDALTACQCVDADNISQR